MLKCAARANYNWSIIRTKDNLFEYYQLRRVEWECPPSRRPPSCVVRRNTAFQAIVRSRGREGGGKGGQVKWQAESDNTFSLIATYSSHSSGNAQSICKVIRKNLDIQKYRYTHFYARVAHVPRDHCTRRHWILFSLFFSFFLFATRGIGDTSGRSTWVYIHTCIV